MAIPPSLGFMSKRSSTRLVGKPIFLYRNWNPKRISVLVSIPLQVLLLALRVLGIFALPKDFDAGLGQSSSMVIELMPVAPR